MIGLLMSGILASLRTESSCLPGVFMSEDESIPTIDCLSLIPSGCEGRRVKPTASSDEFRAVAQYAS